MFSRKVISVLSLAALLTVAGAGRASATSYYFTNDSVTGVGGDYGSVELEKLAGDGVKVTVSLAPGETFVSTGNHYAFAFNLLDAPPLTDDQVKVSATTPGFTFVGGGDIRNVPFGNFNYGFTSAAQGGQGTANSLIFTITLAGLTEDSFRVRSDVNKGDGFYFAADIYSPGRDTGTIGAFGETPFGAAATPVPEPASLLLFGTGLTVVARRFRKNRR